MHFELYYLFILTLEQKDLYLKFKKKVQDAFAVLFLCFKRYVRFLKKEKHMFKTCLC